MKNEMKKIIDAVGVIHVELAKLAVELDKVVESDLTIEVKEEEPMTAEAENSGDEKYTREYLTKEVGYNDLKKIATELGVSAKGKRDEVVQRILDAQSGEEESAVEEEPQEKKRAAKKSSKVTDIEEYKAEKAEESAEEEDSVEDQADSLLEENDVEDIIDILREVGIKGITKKNLRSKLIKALSDGLLDEYISEEDDDEEDSDDDGLEVDENTYFEDYDIEGVNDPNDNDEVRLKAMVAVQKKILEDAGRGNNVNIMRKFLADNSTEDEQRDIRGYDDDEVLAAYCELRKAMIDEEGDDYSGKPDEAYYIDDELFQCGHKCIEVDGELVSEVTGDKWEV